MHLPPDFQFFSGISRHRFTRTPWPINRSQTYLSFSLPSLVLFNTMYLYPTLWLTWCTGTFSSPRMRRKLSCKTLKKYNMFIKLVQIIITKFLVTGKLQVSKFPAWGSWQSQCLAALFQLKTNAIASTCMYIYSV